LLLHVCLAAASTLIVAKMAACVLSGFKTPQPEQFQQHTTTTQSANMLHLAQLHKHTHSMKGAARHHAATCHRPHLEVFETA
jgi:hypothetical protein